MNYQDGHWVYSWCWDVRTVSCQGNNNSVFYLFFSGSLHFFLLFHFVSMSSPFSVISSFFWLSSCFPAFFHHVSIFGRCCLQRCFLFVFWIVVPCSRNVCHFCAAFSFYLGVSTMVVPGYFLTAFQMRKAHTRLMQLHVICHMRHPRVSPPAAAPRP